MGFGRVCCYSVGEAVNNKKRPPFLGGSLSPNEKIITGRSCLSSASQLYQNIAKFEVL